MHNRVESCDAVYSADTLDIPFVDNTQDCDDGIALEAAVSDPASLIPAYLQDTYYWSYLNPRNVHWLDREPIVHAILWWQHNKLLKAALSEIAPGSSVLQVAAVYGEFSKKLTEHIGPQGTLKLIDVAPIQVTNTKVKLAEFPNAEVCLADASTIDDEAYDVVLCYFLLHEVPDDYKTRIIENLLRNLKPDGKLIIIDYHKPHWAHPVKPIISLIFDTLEPFAKGLWRKSFREFASDPDQFEWQHKTYFGGLYQRVIVQHKSE